MTIEIPNLTDIPIADVTTIVERSRSRLQEQYPGIDVTGGPAYFLLLLPFSQLSALERAVLARYLAARSLSEIEADPSLADEDVVDGVLSNWGVTRKEATTAHGEIAIVRSTSASLVIPRGAVFTAGGSRYVTTTAYAAQTDESLIADPATDRLISQIGESRYVFTIEVQAEEEGTASRLEKNATLTPLTTPADFITAYAVADFEDGRDLETNAEALARMRAGAAVRSLSTRTSMDATLRNEFPDVVRHSIVGYGDAELTRADRAIFPIKTPGRWDWYVRSDIDLYAVPYEATGTVLSLEDEGALVRIQIPQDALPGFYFARNVIRAESDQTDGFQIVTQTQTYSIPSSGFVNDVQSASEACYSAYAGRAIDVLDDTAGFADLEIGESVSYELELVGQPSIGDIQDYVNQADVRLSDCLVRAPVPCFVRLAMTIDLEEGAAEPDTEAIAESLRSVVHSVGFTGALYRAKLYEAAQALLSGAASIGSFSMHGVVRRPDGTELLLSGSDVLQVPDSPAAQVSAKTVQFFCEPGDVTVETRPIIPTFD